MNIYDMIFPDVLMTSSTSKFNANDKFHCNLEQYDIFMQYFFPFCSVHHEMHAYSLSIQNIVRLKSRSTA